MFEYFFDFILNVCNIIFIASIQLVHRMPFSQIHCSWIVHIAHVFQVDTGKPVAIHIGGVGVRK